MGRRKGKWIGHMLCRNCLLKRVIEGETQVRIELKDEEEDVSSYWTTLMKLKDSGNRKKKH
jgi:hypothetical protein